MLLKILEEENAQWLLFAAPILVSPAFIYDVTNSQRNFNFSNLYFKLLCKKKFLVKGEKNRFEGTILISDSICSVTVSPFILAIQPKVAENKLAFPFSS